jgi:hypothetical protein
MLSGLEKFGGILKIIGARAAQSEKSAGAKRDEAPPEGFPGGGDYLHCVIFSRPYESFRILD